MGPEYNLLMRTKNKKATAKSRGNKAQRRKEDADRLRQIRQNHGWSQKALAALLGVRQPLVSSWERGYGPSPKMYLKLSKLVLDYESQQWLLNKAGADLQTIEGVADGISKRRNRPALPGEVTRVPPFEKIEVSPDSPIQIASHFNAIWQGIEEANGAELIVSRANLPQTNRLRYLTMRDDFMSPQFRRGDILIVDASETDPWKLEEGACVLAYRSAEYAVQQKWEEHRKALEASEGTEEMDRRRRAMEYPFQRLGLFAGWLRKEIRESPTVAAAATAQTAKTQKLVAGEPFTRMRGWFFLEAPWFPVHQILISTQPHYQSEIALSDHVIVGRIVGWLRSAKPIEGKNKSRSTKE